MMCLVRHASLILFVLSLQSAIFQSGNRLLASGPAQQTQSAACTKETPIQNRAGAFGGAQSGALTVTDNTPGSPQSVALGGVGENIVFSKTSLVFPATPVGQTSATRSVSLFSLAGNAIVIGSLTGPNAADFQVVSTSCALFGNPGEVRRGDPCITQLTFTPSAKGTRIVQLVFMNENPASGPSVVLRSPPTEYKACENGIGREESETQQAWCPLDFHFRPFRKTQLSVK